MCLQLQITFQVEYNLLNPQYLSHLLPNAYYTEKNVNEIAVPIWVAGCNTIWESGCISQMGNKVKKQGTGLLYIQIL